MYIFGLSQDAQSECRRNNEREFSGDYRIWYAISKFLFLDARISRESGAPSEWRRRMNRITSVSGFELDEIERRLPNCRNDLKSLRDEPKLEMQVIGHLALFEVLMEIIELRKFHKLKVGDLGHELGMTITAIRKLGGNFT